MIFTTEQLTLNEARQVTLVAMRQRCGGEFGTFAARPAILILPGGGYSMCSDREAEVIALPFLQAGYQAFVLRYSVGVHNTWPNPLADYEQAMALLRAQAEPWGILPDKIAVIGFSAGGHLAACAATMAQHRPNAALLGYAALELDIAQACQPGTDIPSPTAHVDGRTPPCFLFAARDDLTVPIHNTLNFELALARQGIQFESHIYAYGGHGFSTGVSPLTLEPLCDRTAQWTRDAVGWLGDVFGTLTRAGMSRPRCPGKIHGDGEPTLSVECTFAHLRRHPAADQALAPVYAALEAVARERFGGRTEGLYAALGTNKLRGLMTTLGMDDGAIEAMDAVLRQLPNPTEGAS